MTDAELLALLRDVERHLASAGTRSMLEARVERAVDDLERHLRTPHGRRVAGAAVA